MAMDRNKMIDRLIAVALILISVTVIVAARSLPGDAGFFPTIMAYLLGFSCLVLLLQSFRDQYNSEEESANLNLARLFIWCFLALALFFMVMYFDFYLGIFIFVFLSYILLSRQSYLLSFSVSALFSASLYIGFDFLLGVPAPSSITKFIGLM